MTHVFGRPATSAAAALALAAALGGQAAPAPSAPALGGKEPVELVQTLIEQHALQDDMATLEATLRRRLARRPDHGATSRLFDAAMREPLRFSTPLATFAGRLAEPSPRRGYLTAMVDEWRHQYRVEGSCEPPALAPPENIAAAIEQIRRLADHTARLQRSALSERHRRRLERDYADFSRLRRDTIATALRGRDRRLVRRFLNRLDGADMAAMLCAAHSWLRLTDSAWLARLQSLMEAHPQSAAAVLMHTATPLGEIVLSGRGHGRFRTDNLLFSADLGGDDIYGIEQHGFAGKPQFIVDFAGNDRYESSLPGGYAAGLGSVAVHIDQAGDDIYAARAHSQGAAILGVGVLLDLAGDDRYTADSHAQGAALYGVGLLIDAAGDDRYAVSALGQGAGMANGLGVLRDVAGNDVYTATGGTPTNYGTAGLTDAWAQGVARGVRGLAPAGIGVLVDHGGDDSYDAGSFAQGGAYYRGVGQLLDMGGDDTLLGSRYNAGWGAHGGVGRFFDAAGADRYDSRQAVAAGLAWDYSLAQFHDALGDDFYRLGSFSYGSAAHSAVGWFVDAGGDDTYINAQEPADASTKGPNFALFLDVGADAARASKRCQRRDRHGFVIWAPAQAPPCPNSKARELPGRAAPLDSPDWNGHASRTWNRTGDERDRW